MTVTLTWEGIVLTLLAAAGIVCLIYFSLLMKKLIGTLKEVDVILKDSQVVASIAADKATKVDGIIDGVGDTVETVVSGTRLMKNAVGVSGIIVVCVICAVPMLKIGVMQLMLRLTAAVVEPLTDTRVSKMLWEVSETVTTIFGMVIMTAVLFIINICIILAVTV